LIFQTLPYWTRCWTSALKRALLLFFAQQVIRKSKSVKLSLRQKQIPVFFSGNMSLGVNLLIELSKTAAKVLGNSFDIEIVEKHHNRKLDAPSGTALMIADGICSALGKEMHYVYDRHSQRKPRDKADIGIHSIRGGTIVGEHDVIFAGQHEVITLSHRAESRDIFALGALNAAKFLSRQGVGLYSMPDLLK
jgi:4-hydroxy-tetrahydrodipicolinate reductase